MLKLAASAHQPFFTSDGNRPGEAMFETAFDPKSALRHTYRTHRGVDHPPINRPLSLP